MSTWTKSLGSWQHFILQPILLQVRAVLNFCKQLTIFENVLECVRAVASVPYYILVFGECHYQLPVFSQNVIIMEYGWAQKSKLLKMRFHFYLILGDHVTSIRPLKSRLFLKMQDPWTLKVLFDSMVFFLTCWQNYYQHWLSWKCSATYSFWQ